MKTKNTQPRRLQTGDATNERRRKMKKRFTVRSEKFATKEVACSYAKMASEFFGSGYIIVFYDGFAIESYYQGKRVSQ